MASPPGPDLRSIASGSIAIRLGDLKYATGGGGEDGVSAVRSERQAGPSVNVGDHRRRRIHSALEVEIIQRLDRRPRQAGVGFVGVVEGANTGTTEGKARQRGV